MNERLAYTAEAIVRLRSSYAVVQALKARYKIGDRQAELYMAKVRARRRQEATTVDPEMRRDDMRSSLDMVAALALGKTTVVKNDDGTVVMEDHVDPRTGQLMKRPAMKPTPDLQRALHAFRELIHLDGLAQPVKAQVKVDLDADVDVMPDIKELGADGAKALKDFLGAIAPGGDVAAMAGEWFRFAGDDRPKAKADPKAPAKEPEGGV